VASGAFIGINHEHFGQWILLLTSFIYRRRPPGAVASESTQVRLGHGSELTQSRPRAVDYELSNQGSPILRFIAGGEDHIAQQR
jgi:hypothetical protein